MKCSLSRSPEFRKSLLQHRKHLQPGSFRLDAHMTPEVFFLCKSTWTKVASVLPCSIRQMHPLEVLAKFRSLIERFRAGLRDAVVAVVGSSMPSTLAVHWRSKETCVLICMLATKGRYLLVGCLDSMLSTNEQLLVSAIESKRSPEERRKMKIADNACFAYSRVREEYNGRRTISPWCKYYSDVIRSTE